MTLVEAILPERKGWERRRSLPVSDNEKASQAPATVPGWLHNTTPTSRGNRDCAILCGPFNVLPTPQELYPCCPITHRSQPISCVCQRFRTPSAIDSLGGASISKAEVHGERDKKRDTGFGNNDRGKSQRAQAKVICSECTLVDDHRELGTHLSNGPP